MLAKSGVCDARDAFQRAEYFIKNQLRREVTPIKITSSGGVNASWQFSGSKSFRADAGGSIWNHSGFKPTRPYIYIRMNHEMAPQLLNRSDNSFWKLVEEFYDQLMHSGTAASMSNQAMWQQEIANEGVLMLIKTGSIPKALDAARATAFAKGPSVH
jgi:hypothetical protein